jgi:hypothetical protein
MWQNGGWKLLFRGRLPEKQAEKPMKDSRFAV